MSEDNDVIRVGKNVKVSALAERIIKQLERQGGLVRLQAVGAGSVNQAVKAIAIARGYLLEEEVDIICIPSFVEVDIDGQERTAIRMLVEPR